MLLELIEGVRVCVGGLSFPLQISSVFNPLLFQRYDSNSGGEREIQRTMLELLNQLDGFDSRGDVKVIMATNRIETLDPALIRPGQIACSIRDSYRVGVSVSKCMGRGVKNDTYQGKYMIEVQSNLLKTASRGHGCEDRMQQV